MVGRVVENGMERHEVRLGQEGIDIDVLHGELALEAFLPDDVGVEHLHVEADRAFGNLEPDAPHAYDAEGRAEDVLAEVVERVPRAPSARAHCSFALAETTGRGEQQGPCRVGCRMRQHLRRVADGNAAPRGGGDVDVVEPNGYLADDFELRPDRVHEIAVYLVGEKAEDAVDTPTLFQKNLRRRGKLVRPHLGVHLGPDHLKCVGEDFAGDERAGSRHLQRLSRKTSEIRRGPF